MKYMQKRRTQQFVAAFVISGIVIAALCGFILVDLSTDRYMPGQVAPLFEISGLNAGGVRIALLGQYYALETKALDEVRGHMWRWRSLLPNSTRATGGLVAQGYLLLRDYIESEQPPEEVW